MKWRLSGALLILVALALIAGCSTFVMTGAAKDGEGLDPPPKPETDRKPDSVVDSEPAFIGEVPDDSDIVGSVYGFVERQSLETRPVGLRSYVLLPNRAEGTRNTAFLAAIFRAAGGAPVDVRPGADGLHLRDQNVFLIGVRDRGSATQAANAAEPDDAGTTRFATELLGRDWGYDHEFARDFFRQFCRLADGEDSPCEEVTLRGPYVLTVPDRPGTLETLPDRYLIVSLSETDPRAFRAHVSALLRQVTRPVFEDAVETDALKLDVLAFLLRAGDVVSLTEEAFAKSYFFSR